MNSQELNQNNKRNKISRLSRFREKKRKSLSQSGPTQKYSNKREKMIRMKTTRNRSSIRPLKIKVKRLKDAAIRFLRTPLRLLWQPRAKSQ